MVNRSQSERIHRQLSDANLQKYIHASETTSLSLGPITTLPSLAVFGVALNILVCPSSHQEHRILFFTTWSVSIHRFPFTPDWECCFSKEIFLLITTRSRLLFRLFSGTESHGMMAW